jgi:ubiquitin carboxyl-terminal hydrolase 9/24
LFIDLILGFKISGVSEDREGLLDTIQRNRLNYQKRAYQCIKMLTHLFRKSPVALSMLNSNIVIGRQWTAAVEWLHEELERQRGVASQYNYSSWSPPTQSNENTNSFILERSASAKNILQLAFELCPTEVCDFLLKTYFLLKI